MKVTDLGEVFAILSVDVWNANGVQKNCDVVVERGRVKELRAAGSAKLPESQIDGTGKVLLPSGVDNQVHLRVPGQSRKETAETGLRASLRGGVGAILTMPNTEPVIDTPEILAEARAAVRAAEAATGVKVFWSAAMTVGQKGETPTDPVKLKSAGVLALTDDGKGVARDEVMRAVFAANAQAKLPLLQHAEVPGHGAALAAGPVQQKLGLKPYPASAEFEMVARDLKLLAEFPEQRYHVLHVSSRRTVELVAEAKKRGLHASAETSPHHLLFTSADISESDTSFKMNPPLRDADDRSFLRAALADGRLDFVATDHAPHEASAKGTDFSRSAFGTTGLEAFFRTLWKLHAEGGLTATRLVEVFSTAPARFLGIHEEFGAVGVGRPLRAILVDPRAPARALVPEELESLSKNSCFVGAKLPGHVHWHFNGAGAFEF